MNELELTPERRWRPRISLVAALMFMAIVGMAIVMVQKWRESDAQRREIGRLRDELGYLSIDNENMIYVKQIDVNEPDTRRFRIYLPKNKEFKLYSRILTVPGRQPNESKCALFVIAVIESIPLTPGGSRLPPGYFKLSKNWAGGRCRSGIHQTS